VVIVTLDAFGGSLRMHFTNAVPCLGLLKIEMGKSVLMEAIEWGVDAPEDAVPQETPQETPDTKPQPEAPKPGVSEKDGPEKKDTGARTGPPKKLEAAAGTKGPANPLYDAKVGEWVRMRSVVQGEETVATLRVIEVSDDEVKLESRVAYGGTEIKGAVINRPRRATLQLGGRGKVVLGKEALQIRGEDLACITVTRTTRRGQVDKRWICPDIPVNGLVRHVRGKKVVK